MLSLLPHNAFTFLSSSFLLEERIKLQELELSANAKLLPIPEDAPVIQMVFPWILPISTVLDSKYT